MPINENGTANCDRCGTPLDGYGVLYGLISTDLDADGMPVERIYCYVPGCRDAVIDGLVAYPFISSAPACSTCQVPLPFRGTDNAMLAQDLNPDGTARTLTFCYVNGHRDQFLTQGRL